MPADSGEAGVGANIGFHSGSGLVSDSPKVFGIPMPLRYSAVKEWYTLTIQPRIRTGPRPMPQFNDTELTAAVIRSFEETPDPRVKFLLEELVKSLHDYVRKTDLSFDEWGTAIDFLTRVGQKCTSTRQEFILLSDVMGVSMLVDAVNHRERDGATETTVLGPFYVGEHKAMPHGADISPDLDGEMMFVQSRVTDLAGKPLANVPVDVWHADNDGYYDSQRPTYETTGPSSRARFITDADGRFFFRTILPCSYPIPTDGPVGEMILQTRRHPMRPAHVHFLVDAPGYEPLITHVFIEGDKYLDSDVVFGVKDDLISKIEKRSDAMMPDGKPANGPWHLMTYDFKMKPGAGSAPKPMMAAEKEDA
jgi:protocatechuate 3,4-dioxygenase beta subunit